MPTGERPPAGGLHPLPPDLNPCRLQLDGDRAAHVDQIFRALRVSCPSHRGLGPRLYSLSHLAVWQSFTYPDVSAYTVVLFLIFKIITDLNIEVFPLKIVS